MKPLGISHDYAHCKGHGCKLKETCVRYLLSVEAREMGLTMVTYLTPYFDWNRCRDYWKIREDKK